MFTPKSLCRLRPGVWQGGLHLFLLEKDFEGILEKKNIEMSITLGRFKHCRSCLTDVFVSLHNQFRRIIVQRAVTALSLRWLDHLFFEAKCHFHVPSGVRQACGFAWCGVSL